MMILNKSSLTEAGQEILMDLLERESVAYYEGHIYELYLRQSVEEIAYGTGNEPEFIREHLETLTNYIMGKAVIGHIRDDQLQEEIGENVFEYLATKYVIENGEVDELRELVNNIPEQPMMDRTDTPTRYESDNFVITEYDNEMTHYERKGHGALITETIEDAIQGIVR